MKKIQFSEKFAISDLSKNAVSDLTRKYLFDREHGKGHNITKLFTVDVRNNNLYIHYRTYPTYNTGEEKRVLISGEAVRTEYYDTLFEIEDVETNLGDKNTFLSLHPGEQLTVLKDFINDGMSRVFCNCPAFYYQGHWEDMAETDSVIFPFPGPRGDGVWRQRHASGLKIPEIRICKHIAASIHYLVERDAPKILKALVKVYEKF